VVPVVASSVPALGPTLVEMSRKVRSAFFGTNKISSLASTFFLGAQATKQSKPS
jgi:hypothetical protein